ncbi:uncharacterized protein LOC119460594 isoform X2 [Dermacentor silvarum]|uniref:uncharacterized protein LOC119460594 isoform X2 n=1 Tax=Dermacentor silvarum TaxID=543639 RepID=UPI002100B6F3|nr:uncharacterized protein LOC119460594 isoform X2 [Dermacentor silvarum]
MLSPAGTGLRRDATACWRFGALFAFLLFSVVGGALSYSSSAVVKRAADVVIVVDGGASDRPLRSRGGSPDNVGIYQVTLVVAAVFMVVVFSVFVACVVKRTCERSRDLAERMRELAADVYTVPAEFEGLERPPSYTDIVKIDNMVYGVPPPDYSTVSPPPDLEAAAPSLPPRRMALSALLWQAAARRQAPNAVQCSVAHGDSGGSGAT